MVSYHRKMAARCSSNLVKQISEALCDCWKAPEIKNLHHRLFPFTQDD